MEKLWTFVQGMTFWNWIALIAFLFFPLSALNAFFSLKSRYLDWRGTKTKKEFERRVIQLEATLSRLEEFEDNPTKFFMYVLHQLLGVLAISLGGLLFFFSGFFFYASPIGSVKLFTNGMFFIISVLFIFMAFLIAIRLAKLVHMVYNPMILTGEIFNFLENASRQGFTIEPESRLWSRKLRKLNAD